MKTLRPNIRTEQILITITVVFILFWLFALYVKISNFDGFRRSMQSQVFYWGFANFLVYAVPISEFTAATLLTVNRTRLAGLIWSMVLLLLYTGYTALVLLDYYKRVPCECINLIRGMGFKQHLYFNLFFVAIATTGIILTFKDKERRTSVWIR